MHKHEYKNWVARPVSKFAKVSIIVISIGLAIIGIIAFAASKGSMAVLAPEGTIADQQRDLIVFATLLMLVIVVPVFALLIGISWRYRASNKKAKYAPDWDRNRLAEVAWWGFPILIIIILASVAWVSSHKLDPYRKIEADAKPLTVQVVALQWKWLFIYPEQNIATVNYLQIPEKTPINLEITSDGPMNSFWIPQLGGQIYAMAGMQTQLNLMADKTGTFQGSSANLSGEGFAGMKFETKSTNQADFDTWVASVKNGDNILNEEHYEKLSAKSENNPPTFYANVSNDLFKHIVDSFVKPSSSENSVSNEMVESTHE